MNDSTKSILIITNLFPSRSVPWGGSFVASRVSALRAAGHVVQVVALIPVRPRMLRGALWLLGRTGAAHGEFDDPRFTYVQVPMSTVAYLRAWWGVYPARAVDRAAQSVARHVAGVRFDAVIAHGMYMLPAGSVAQALAGDGNYVVVCHGGDINVLMRKRTDHYAAVLNRARAAIFVSSSLAANAESRGLCNPAVRIIPNGVDTSLFTPDRRIRARTALAVRDKHVIAYVGSLLPVKGADRLCELADALNARAYEGLILVGGDGPLRAGLEARAPSNVQFLGRLSRDGVADVLAASDVIVLPSRSEGWPTVILEAFASETGVVGTAVGGIPEAVGDLGSVVPHDNDVVENLADALLRELDRSGSPERKLLRTEAMSHSWDGVALAELEAALA